MRRLSSDAGTDFWTALPFLEGGLSWRPVLCTTARASLCAERFFLPTSRLNEFFTMLVDTSSGSILERERGLVYPGCQQRRRHVSYASNTWDVMASKSRFGAPAIVILRI